MVKRSPLLLLHNKPLKIFTDLHIHTGADVHIQCKIKANAPKTAEVITFSVNRTTDDYGVYKFEIPSLDGVDCVDGPPIQSMCQATLIGSSLSECNVPGLRATTDEISVKSKQDNLCVYSFTALSFRPHKKNSTLCGKGSSEPSSSSKFLFPQSFPWPPLPFPFSTPPPSSPFPFPHIPTSPSMPPLFQSPTPPTLPFPFPHLPTSPSIPPLFQSPPPPSFSLGDPKTWIPHIPLMSPPPSPPPAFDLLDPRTWRPLFPPSPPANPQKQNP